MNRWLLFLPILIGCSAHNPVVATVPPTAPSIDLAAEHAYVAKLAHNILRWDADSLGQYERPEIATVKSDIEACYIAKTDEQFLTALDKLQQDAEALKALDEALNSRGVI